MTAVVVTHNRSALLRECLDAISAQTTPPSRVVVVDNASTDDTSTLLAERDDVDVLTLRVNTGGAGGFAAGIDEALRSGCDAAWLLDDDTIPEPDCLAELVRAWTGYPGRRPAVTASRVVWTDGRDHPMNTPRTRPGASREELEAASGVGARPVRSASFVSILVDSGAARATGLPIADYFLWNDDFEYTTRLIRAGGGIAVPTSVAVHKTRTFGDSESDPGERFYYEVRNKVWTFTRSAGLTPAEKALYGASTLLRWARTFIDSSRRDVLWDGLRRGVRDGRRSPSYQRGARGRLESDGVGREPFSVLLAAYAGDDPDHLRRSLRSVTVEQTRAPTEVVVVCDGPVGADLEQALQDAARATDIPIVRVDRQHNEGLGRALDAGLARCRFDIVARQDADDISVPERFAVQLPVIQAGADLVGSALLEFGEDEHDILGRRTPPTDEAEIRRRAHFKDPFNHPTVVYRRAAVQAVGGYEHLPLLEDYWLFMRMLESGVRAVNVADALVLYRVGAGAYARRGGMDLLRSEIDLQRRMLAAGYLTRTQHLRNVAVRGGYRLVPESARRLAYRTLFTSTRVAD